MINSVKKPTGCLIAPSNHGMMIVNRFDYQIECEKQNKGHGVGFEILENQSFDEEEVNNVLKILDLRRALHGDGLIALDCGANIGVHTVEWAKHMFNWGYVISFEPQEKIYYALAGNITLNNCFNVKAYNSALGDKVSVINVPRLNYFKASSFGSLELEEKENNEFIGQKINYNKTTEVNMLTIDSLNLKRLDLVKIDVEGMEEKVLKGSLEMIKVHKPIFVVEKIKSNQKNLINFFVSNNYTILNFGLNFLCVSNEDPCKNKICGLETIK